MCGIPFSPPHTHPQLPSGKLAIQNPLSSPHLTFLSTSKGPTARVFVSEQISSPVHIFPASNKEDCCACGVISLITRRTLWHLAALPASGRFGEGGAGWEGCSDRGQHPVIPWVGSVPYFLAQMKPKPLFPALMCQQREEKGDGLFILLGVGEASITPCHS